MWGNNDRWTGLGRLAGLLFIIAVATPAGAQAQPAAADPCPLGGDVNSNDVNQLAKSAACYLTAKNDKAAIARLDQIIAIDPAFPLAYQLRGEAHLNAGDFQKAVADLSVAIQKNPANLQSYILLSRSYMALGRYNNAQASLQSALKIAAQNPPPPIEDPTVSQWNPNEEKIYLLLSDALLKQGNRAEAEQALSAGLEKNTGSRKLFERLILMLTEDKKDQEKKTYQNKYCTFLGIKKSPYCYPEH
jgi:tetratricopeptide (TPR) repeat protein